MIPVLRVQAGASIGVPARSVWNMPTSGRGGSTFCVGDLDLILQARGVDPTQTSAGQRVQTSGW